MKAFPHFAFAILFFCLAPGFTWAQQLQSTPTSHAFGKVQIGSSVSFAIQLSNIGTKTLRIASKSVTGSEFSFGTFPVPVKISPGSSIQLPVIFTPTAKGYTSGTVTLVSNDPNSPLTIHVAGTGFCPVAAQLAVTPVTLSFGNVTVGSSASLQATLTASNAAVTISSDDSTSSEFSILGLTLPVTIAAGQSVAVTIQFTPSAAGAATGQAGFTSNAANSPTVEQLTGTGVAQVAHSVYLSWDAGSGNPVGYNVYRGTASGGPYEMINTALEASTNYTDNTVVCGTTYYYVATEVNAEGQESGYSNIGQAVIPTS
ncbi:MAG: choice-of-anchor D domain-containing protein [Terriglobales bacterium]